MNTTLWDQRGWWARVPFLLSDPEKERVFVEYVECLTSTPFPGIYPTEREAWEAVSKHLIGFLGQARRDIDRLNRSVGLEESLREEWLRNARSREEAAVRGLERCRERLAQLDG